MELAADKAVKELDWKSIEYLFRPSTFFELTLRLDFKGMVAKVEKGIAEGEMPHEYRAQYYPIVNRAIQVEEFYRAVKAAREELDVYEAMDREYEAELRERMERGDYGQ